MCILYLTGLHLDAKLALGKNLYLELVKFAPEKVDSLVTLVHTCIGVPESDIHFQVKII